MTTTSITERVQRGAAWLDHHTPGWRDSITPNELDLEDGCACVLGQVYAEASTASITYEDGVMGGHLSGYEYVIATHATSEDWPADHGFTVSPWRSRSWHARTDEFRALETAWLNTIHSTPAPLEAPVQVTA